MDGDPTYVQATCVSADGRKIDLQEPMRILFFLSGLPFVALRGVHGRCRYGRVWDRYPVPTVARCKAKPDSWRATGHQTLCK